MRETFMLKIEKMTFYRARVKTSLEVFRDHSKAYQKLFQYAATIHKADSGAICKVSCDVASIPDKVLLQRFFIAFFAQKNAFLNSCRPFIRVEQYDYQLKGKYSGVVSCCWHGC